MREETLGLDGFSLSGRLELLTGASRGIGRALAAGLASASADLVLITRSGEVLDAVADGIHRAGLWAKAVVTNVTDLASLAARDAHRTSNDLLPQILINNAGGEEVRPSIDVDEAPWDRIVDINLKRAFFAATRRLHEADRSGSILNFCSLTSLVGVPTAVPCTRSGSGLPGMTRAPSAEWASAGVRVNAIGPGNFRSGRTERFNRDATWRDAMLARIPQGRFGRLEDLVGASVFPCGDAAANVTGRVLMISGDYSASI